MGVLEIVDFARDFAVMVRVQGPDPKGLKMREQAFHHYNSGKTTLSASGMLLPRSFSDSLLKKFHGDKASPESMLAVTVASVIEPFLSLHHRKNFSQANPELIPGVQIDIMIEGKKRANAKGSGDEVSQWLQSQLLALVDIPLSSSAVQSIVGASSGSLEHGWTVGWSLASCSNGSKPFLDAVQTEVEHSTIQGPRQIPVAELRDPNEIGKSATRVALLQISSKSFVDLPILNISTPNNRGDLLVAVGSPFGILSPLHFFNSISIGYIANFCPPNSHKSSLLMADIRCLPGMEGCPVFGEHERFIGILTRPLRQKTSGAEIQLVIPWEAIATACDDRNPVKRNPFYIRKSNSIGNTHLSNYDSDQIIKSPVEKAMASICLITIDNGAWASGVLLNKYGLILTNAHLLEPWRFGKITTYSERDEIETEEIARPPNRRIRVRLDCLDPWIWSNAKVVYVSKGPLDVALLKLEFVPDKICPIDVDFTRPIPGSKACVIGHGLFGPRSDLLPSVSHGVIAKVVETRRPNKDIPLPAMIETTAAVHPGGSGGAVVNLDGHMIGLVTSNARHGGGTVIPYLNFSISSSALEPIFRFSKDMKDVLPLEELNEPNEDLSSVWDLMPPLSPEPGPTLPNLLPGENKDIKGSRFAKFITERHEELKKTSPEGKTKSFSSRFTLSKL